MDPGSAGEQELGVTGLQQAWHCVSAIRNGLLSIPCFCFAFRGCPLLG